jgi:hypothetical protein
MSETFWTLVLSLVVAGIVSGIGAKFLATMGRRAYTEGAAPGAPEAFTAFATQVLRIATVLAVVGTALIAALYGILNQTALISLPSGITGYVLGGGTQRLPTKSVVQNLLPKPKSPGGPGTRPSPQPQGPSSHEGVSTDI